MNCSPPQFPLRTIIPPVIRNWIGDRLRGPPRGPRRRHPRACLFALGRIGDFVLTLSALRLLLRELGPAHCVLVIPQPSEPIAAREFPAVRRIVLPADASSLTREIIPAWWRERRKFAEDHFGQRICLSHQRGLFYELVLSWIDAEKDARLMPATYPEAAADGLCTELLAHWRLVETVLGRPVDREEILPRFTSVLTGDDGRLLVFPLSRDPTRSLIPEAMIDTLGQWRRHNAAPVVFAGSPADAPVLGQFATAARAAGIARVSVETPGGLDALLGQIAGAGALLCGDSAPAHIATALDKPAVVMTSRAFFGYAQPWMRSDRQQVFVHGTPPDRVAASLPALSRTMP